MLKSDRTCSQPLLRCCFSLLVSALFLAACKKTVVSDKITTVTTPTPSAEPPRRGIGDGLADTQTVIRISGTKCAAERTTEFALKVAGLKNTEWVKFGCKEGKETFIKVDTKKGYCNILQLRPYVLLANKQGVTIEEYYRETANSNHKFFFKVTQSNSQNSISKGVRISFEDTTDAYISKTYNPCKEAAEQKKDLNTTKVFDEIEKVEKTCAQVLGMIPDKEAAVEWNDFEFTVESDQVQFTVEGFPEMGCSPN